MFLVEGFRLIESITILCAHHVCMQVLLSSPSGPIEEVHSSCESTCRYCAKSLDWHLHVVVMIYLIHVTDLLAQVVSWLEPWVGECLSSSCCHLGVPDAWVSCRESTLSILAMNCMHCGVGTRNL